MSSINYVIATWSGRRRAQKQWNFLEHHLTQLKATKHNLTQITIVVPDHNEHSKFSRTVDKAIACGYTIVRRPNIGLSYGGYSQAFDLFGMQFDYYIFLEDDFVFLHDHFDSTLVQLIEERNVDYLCALVRNVPITRHAAHEAGIIRSSALAKVKERFGCLYYHATSNPKNPYEDQGGQIRFSTTFFDVGCTIDHFADIYHIPYWGGRWQYYGNRNGPDFLVPFEYCQREECCRSVHELWVH